MLSTLAEISSAKMVKHNNVIPNAHFKKYWQKHVRTWFDQPGKKDSRRQKRIVKAKAVAPRPLGYLRPVVRCQTIKYNRKIKAGKGFTIDELKAAGIAKKHALQIGIAVDHRRKNRSQESFQNNVNRLKLYKAKLVIFPSRAAKKNAKNQKKVEETKGLKQVKLSEVLPLSYPRAKTKARKVAKGEKEATVTKVLRKALTDKKLAGAREKRAKDKAAGVITKGAKKGKAAAAETTADDADAGGEDGGEE